MTENDIPLEAIVENMLRDAGLRDFTMILFGGKEDKHTIANGDLTVISEKVAGALTEWVTTQNNG